METVAPEQVGLSSQRLARLAPLMQSYVDQGKLAGLITLVARRGQVAHLQCFGQADTAAGKPMQPDTILRIYSMTKPVTRKLWATRSGFSPARCTMGISSPEGQVNLSGSAAHGSLAVGNYTITVLRHPGAPTLLHGRRLAAATGKRC